jgi:signal transduction histidine kinase
MPVSNAKQTRQRLGVLFSLPLFFCIVFFVFEVFNGTANNHLLAIQNLEGNVNTLRSLAKDAESSERGFLLTGDEVLLSPFKQAQITLPKMQLKVDSGEEKQAQLQAELNRVAGLAQQRLNQTDRIVKIQKAKGFAAAIEATKSPEADRIMSDLRQGSIDALKDLSAREQAALNSQQRLSTNAFIFFSLGTVVMIAVMYWLYNEVLSYIEARDQAQEQLEKFNSDLHAMVDERTKDLVEANRELQQFAYVASHDLQEPLRTITSFSQLMAVRYKGRLEDDADEFIGYIVTASKRMTDLINALLQIVRLRKAGQPTMRVSFDKLLDDAEASLQASIRENQVRISRGPLPELLVDRVQMLQVLQNLISNAIKYRRTEAPVIHVFATRSSSEWQISVADNGRGFGQEFSERIFGLFQRLHGREVEGTGMGLYIARRIIERHGGRIWAESKEGLGSTFFFTLPVGLEPGKTASVSSPGAGESTRSGLTPRPGRVAAQR